MRYITYKGKQYSVSVPGKFEDDSMCIELIDGYEIYARLTFYAHDGTNGYKASEGCVWLKDWWEDKDFAPFLVAEGYFQFTGREIPQKYVVYKEAKITDKLSKLIKGGL